MPKNPKSPPSAGKSNKPSSQKIQPKTSAAAPKNAPLPQFISVDDAAQSLGVSVKTVRRHIVRGTLPARRCGRRVLIGRADFVMFAVSLGPVV